MLFFVLTMVLCVPPVRSFTMGGAAILLSSTAKVGINVNHLELSILFSVRLRSIRMYGRARSYLLGLRLFAISLGFSSLLQKQVSISNVRLVRKSMTARSVVPNVRVGKRVKHFFVSSRNVSLPRDLVAVGGTVLSRTSIRILLGSSAMRSAAASTPLG